MVNAYFFYGAVIFALLAIHKWMDPGKLGAWVGAFVIFFLLCAGSVENGSDWIWYRQGFFGLEEFGNFQEALVSSVYEPGFLFLMYSAHALGLSYQYVVAVVALICVSCWWYFARSVGFLSPALLLAFLILIDGWTLYNEQLRQAVAVSIFLPVLVWATNGWWIRVLLGIIFALTFHTSAIFILPMLVLQQCLIRWPKMWHSWMLLMSYAAAVWAGIGITVSLVQAEVFNKIGLQFVQNKLAVYLESENYGAPLISAGLISYAIGTYVLILARRVVMERGNLWMNLIWHFSAMWCLLGPIFRIVGIFVRFEHFLLIFLVPLCAFLWQSTQGRRSILALGQRAALLSFALVFFLRISLHPEQTVWVNNYQNYFVNFFLDERWDTLDRQDMICSNLDENGNDFCKYGELKY